MGVLLTILMEFLASSFTKIYFHAAFKIAITLAFITLVVAAVYAYVQTFSVIVNGIALTVPEIVNGVWGWFMPYNINLCVLAIMSCYVLRFVTRLYLRVVNFKFKASISN
jgi:hypothetical protein